LYSRTYEEFRGKQLPPRPLGLEQAFVRFGVAPKQRTNARLIFDKSAVQAGFFTNGPDRLVMPIVSGAPPAPPLSTLEVPHHGWRPNAAGDGTLAGHGLSGLSASSTPQLHPFIQGLLDTLPAPETNWSVEGRAKWLQAAAHCFDLIYMGDGMIVIEAKQSEGARKIPCARAHEQFTGDPATNKAHVDDEITS
jgi:hypothetical protein